ncbi:MAG TPA: hypothetical protein DIS76_05435 [Rhodospirillaceae bacterium]|nr:hypothetical protein [Rhodospirillaceae bacterium]
MRADLAAMHPAFRHIGKIVAAESAEFGAAGPIDPNPFPSAHPNFYQTNAIARASEIMAKCVAELAPQARKEAA